MSCRFLPMIAIVLMSQSRPSFAQTKSLAEALGKLTSRTDTVRFQALADLRSAARAGHLDLCSPRAAESVKSGLLRALAVENALIFDHSDPTVELGEGDGDFQAELIGCVASLHDPRGAHELASALDTGGGAVNGLLGLGGDVAANEIVAILASPKKRIELRMDAAELAGRQTAPSTRTPVSAENRARLRTVLLASLADHSGEIRSSAVLGLHSFLDDEVRAAIVRIAQSDTGTITAAGTRLDGAAPAAREWLKLYSTTKPRVSPPL